MSNADYIKYFGEHHNGPFRDVLLLSLPIKPLRDISGSEASLQYLKDMMHASERRQNKILTLFEKSRQEKAVLINAAGYHLDRPLCIVSCTDFVSHYIGETEKNITRLMAMAETKKWILFFDDADALFSFYSSEEKSKKNLLDIRSKYLIKLISSHAGVLILSINSRTCLEKVLYATDSFEPTSASYKGP